MKTLPGLIAVSLLLTFTAQANPGAFREPNRVVGNQQFNLTLLFNWWEKAESAGLSNEHSTNKAAIRPLPGWFKATATDIRDGGSVWIIKGTISSSPTNSRPYTFCLAHPPINERAAFNAAVNQLAVASNDHERAAFRASANRELATQYGNTASQLDYIRQSGPILYCALSDASARSYRDSARHQALSDEARADAGDAIAQKRAAEAVLANFKNTTSYEFDHFVYATGQTYNGLPLFDTGLIGH